MLMKNRYKRKILFQNNNIDYSVREFTIPNANEYQRFEVTFQNNDGRKYIEIIEPNQTQIVSRANVGGGTVTYDKMAIVYLNTSTNKLTLASVGERWTYSNGTGGVKEGNFITVLKVVGILGGA